MNHTLLPNETGNFLLPPSSFLLEIPYCERDPVSRIHLILTHLLLPPFLLPPFLLLPFLLLLILIFSLMCCSCACVFLGSTP